MRRATCNAMTSWWRATLMAPWWPSGRTAAIVGLLLVGGLAASGLYAVAGARGPGDLEKRVQELQATQARLYEMVAASEGQLESQRRIYQARIRKAETLLREREREVVMLRAQLLRAAEDPAPVR
jgi:hypothetical protein